MKIIQVSTYFHPYIGGVERVVYELSKQLTVLGHDVTVLTTDRKNSIKDFSGFTVIKSKQLIEVCGEPVSISLFNYLKKSKVDLVHIHFSKLLIPTISVIICRLIGLPTIITLHVVDDYKSSLKRLLSFLYRISIGRLVFKFANKIVVPSEINLEEKLIQRYKNKVLVIPHGVNLNFKSRKKKRHGKFRVLFVGKLSRRLYFKGLNFLIRAMSRLSKNIELVVIGEGETKKEYQKLTKILGLEDRVKFLGYVKEDELWKCYSSADCLVLPSTSKLESFGLVALEAMSMKLPVIVTNVCGISPIVEKSNSGIVIKPENSELIANAIKRLFYDRKLREKLSKNAERTAKKYNWELIAKRYVEVYEGALKVKSQKGGTNQNINFQ